ncbi:LacI family DNA-binding transcriptional regulator [Desertihabitans brevis]|uniref:LacI family DNA-binding transcriptional regulator n=1 Tax=Desertihabitans brevis TaxID=2268447 RepID=A0A367YQC5_9ACTN|nr:LacI family DNA-binding transcriptional regulator [Desertihabitans brevis]RCK68095.1 LacI family DNA-binding transcriptional regulator [Desertihabitans brevis]
MLTLKDIAERVGVSPSTVSLVLNDQDGGRVRAESAQRIRAVAEEMGYVPNLVARGLKTRQSQTFGVLADGVATIPFAGQMLAGAQEVAWEQGFLLMLIDTGANADLEGPAVRALLQRHIQALVIAAEFHRSVRLPVTPPRLPVVLLDGVPADDPSGEERPVDAVVPDERGGAHAAVQHLVQAGHRRVGLLTVADDRFVAEGLRREGYLQALREAGIDPDPSLVVAAASPDTVHGREPATALLDRPDRPTAVFCFSDRLAMAAYQSAAELGLRVPEDVSVVGFDNQVAVADALLPGLTTVQLPHREMGAWAAERAVQRVRSVSGPGERHLMPCPLVLRHSVAPPR